MSFASSFLVVSKSASTSTLTGLLPKAISMMSPTLTLTEAFASLPLTMTRPASHASFATVRRLIRRDTFKNLSQRIVLTSFLLIQKRLKTEVLSQMFIKQYELVHHIL